MIEKYGSYGDEFWVDARGVKPLTAEDLAPIHPDVTDKKIVVDLSHQTLSCYEGKDEVLFTRVSTGAKYNSEGQIVDNWSTPVGDYHGDKRGLWRCSDGRRYLCANWGINYGQASNKKLMKRRYNYKIWHRH